MQYDQYYNEAFDYKLSTTFRRAVFHFGKNERLFRAARNGLTDKILELISSGVDIHAEDDRALRLAALHGQKRTVKTLIDAGANVHAMNDLSLRLAAGLGDAETVRILLKAGANVHAVHDHALNLAISKGHSVTERVLRQWIERKRSMPPLTDDHRFFPPPAG